jgi:hypothetical protein
MLTTILAGASDFILSSIALALVATMAWIITLLLTSNSILPLELLLGASVFSRRRAACLGWRGSPVVAVLLRAWWILIASLGVLAVPLGMALGGVLLAASEPFPVPSDFLQGMNLVGGILYLALVLPAVASFTALIVLAIPFALAALVRFARELAGNLYWVPKARRYGLGPALAVLVAVTILLLAIIAELGNMLGWQHITVFSFSLGALDLGTLSVRGLVLILAAGLPYLLLLDLPYRIGIRRWRAQRLADLDARRADLESQVRRLATQDASDELLRAMQYDLVLLQFYKSQMDDARSTSTAPFRAEGRIIATALAIIFGLLVDGLGGFVVHTLSLPR